MKIREMLKGVTIKAISDNNLLGIDVDDITFNTNDIKENSLCVLYKGTNVDSHQFVEEFYKSGKIIAFVCEKSINGYPYILVEDAKKALALICKNYFSVDESDFVSVGITGTNGKTTITYLLSSILEEYGEKYARIGTVNYTIDDEVIESSTTTPSSYEFFSCLKKAKDKKIKYILTEVSSHALKQYRLYGFKFDISVFTNLTGDHLDYHYDMEDYFRAKRQLFTNKYSKSGVINIDDIYGFRLYKNVKIKKYTYSFDKGADLYVSKSKFSLELTKAKLVLFGKSINVESNLIGRHNLYNIMAAILTATNLNIPLGVIIKGVKRQNNIPGRLEKIVDNGIYYFVDYAHTDDALKNVLSTLKGFKKNRLILVFGCGGNRDKMKRPRMGKIASEFADIIIVTNDNPRNENPDEIINDIRKGINNKKSVIVEKDRRKAIFIAYSLAKRGDIVLIAGKGHENYQIVKDKKVFFDDRLMLRDILGENIDERAIRGY
ncbi:MAG: UDP-N-acetylmuramoyl-L-alanyl-D-glutamate--2,6-diaminopimelate ligase [Deferribacterota bacterium]|nr:UDP-N-acetylmuramoyl-L-alanyl-D-glutamate--2,6-diaminopimelate ligase [Deferribacterota bacterium]